MLPIARLSSPLSLQPDPAIVLDCLVTSPLARGTTLTFVYFGHRDVRSWRSLAAQRVHLTTHTPVGAGSVLRLALGTTKSQLLVGVRIGPCMVDLTAGVVAETPVCIDPPISQVALATWAVAIVKGTSNLHVPMAMHAIVPMNGRPLVPPPCIPCSHVFVSVLDPEALPAYIMAATQAQSVPDCWGAAWPLLKYVAWVPAASIEFVDANAAGFGIVLSPGALLPVARRPSSGSLVATPVCTANVRITGSTLTVVVMGVGQVVLGQTVTGPGIASNTIVTAFGTGTGGSGTYTVSVAQTVTPGVDATLTSAPAFDSTVVEGTIAGTQLTVTSVQAGNVRIGQTIEGPGVVWGTTITGLGTGLGTEGTYVLSTAQVVAVTTVFTLVTVTGGMGPVVGLVTMQPLFPWTAFDICTSVSGPPRWRWTAAAWATPVFVTASIAGNVLDVTQITHGAVNIGWWVRQGATDTRVTGYLTGRGGIGTYTVSVSQILPAQSMELTAGDGPMSITGFLSGSTLTVTSLDGDILTDIVPGMHVMGPGVLSGTKIVARGTGEGGVGTYCIDPPQVVSLTSQLTIQPPWSDLPPATTLSLTMPCIPGATPGTASSGVLTTMEASQVPERCTTLYFKSVGCGADTPGVITAIQSCSATDVDLQLAWGVDAPYALWPDTPCALGLPCVVQSLPAWRRTLTAAPMCAWGLCNAAPTIAIPVECLAKLYRDS